MQYTLNFRFDILYFIMIYPGFLYNQYLSIYINILLLLNFIFAKFYLFSPIYVINSIFIMNLCYIITHIHLIIFNSFEICLFQLKCIYFYFYFHNYFFLFWDSFNFFFLHIIQTMYHSIIFFIFKLIKQYKCFIFHKI